MIRLSKLWTGLRARARQVQSPSKISPSVISKANLSVGLAVALGAFCASWHDAAANPAETTPTPIVATQAGPVQGFFSEGVAHFLGIPYAAPPVGNLRWRPNDVLKATEYAPICALIETLGVFSGPANNNEDCLYLNVFTPTLRRQQARLAGPDRHRLHGISPEPDGLSGPSRAGR
jgi:hypothetical protein